LKGFVIPSAARNLVLWLAAGTPQIPRCARNDKDLTFEKSVQSSQFLNLLFSISLRVLDGSVDNRVPGLDVFSIFDFWKVK
jgi:hypothetical protein